MNNRFSSSQKPHCIVLATRENSAPVKLGGFGHAIELNPLDILTNEASGRVGSVHFMSPEMLQNRTYGPATDIWSCGVLLYVMLSGNLPFLGTKERLQEAITSGRVSVRLFLFRVLVLVVKGNYTLGYDNGTRT